VSDNAAFGSDERFFDHAAYVEAVIVKTLTEKPPNATHCSTRGRAPRLGMSQPTLSRIWKAFGLNRDRSTRSSRRPIRCSWTRSKTSWGST
jgi:hypothetical protein